ncbi:MAG: TonB-dependent receptor plug domain-containing protein [Candidatus Poribacteria bacterium]
MNIKILSSLIFVMMSLFLSLAAATESEKDEVIQLEEIRVTPGRYTISDSMLLPNSLSKAEIDNFPLIDNDVYRAAHVFPGVVANDFSARFSVRGGEKDETIVRLDGMELYEPYHLQDFGGAVSTIDLGIVQKADLLMGGFPAEYGDKMSGVFDVFAREGSRKEFRGNLGIDIVNTHLLLEGPISKGSWLLAARRGYIDLIMALIESEEQFEPRYADLYTKVTHDLTSKDKISVDILYALDSNKIDQEGEENDLKSKYNNGILWGRWRHLFGEKAFSDLYLFAGDAGQEKRDGIDGIDDRDFTYFGGKGELNYKPASSHTLKAGVKWQWAAADYHYKEEKVDVNVNPSGWDTRGFLQDEWQIASPIAANFGLRYIYQHYNQHFELGPRVAVALKLSQKFLIRGAWGLYHQPVEILNLPVEDGITEFGKPEEATHYILGCELSPKQNLLIRAEAYYKTLDNLVGQIRDYGRKSQIIINPESGTAKGFELFVNQLISPRVSWSVGYAYSVAKEKAGGHQFFRDFDQRHALALNVGYAFSDNLNVHLSWRFHSGNPYTEVRYEKVSVPGGEVWQKRLGPINSKRLPAYHSLDLRLTRIHTFKHWKLHWYFQVLNLYNRQNVHEYSFTKITDASGNILRYERNEEHLLPILPVLGVSGEF